ncbi:MAG: amino acid ABC transporter permease [Proteobacteria bacterium]|nr:amino acid ABC transporter permease [Pseudomonadota bacterium]
MNATAWRKLRFSWLDAVVLASVLGFALYVAYRMNSVLNYRWGWMQVLLFIFRWDEGQGRWVANLLVQGLLTTLRLAVWGILIAALIGLTMGMARVSKRLFPRLVGRVYVELVRNIPPLVFMFIFYFFISSQLMPMLGIDRLLARAAPSTLSLVAVLFGEPKLIPNFVSGLICLALFEGAYITEIVRAGIEAIEKGQWEAGSSLGLSRTKLMRLVILPQAVQRILPPLAGQFITLIKTSSIVSLISVQELTFLASEVAVSTSRTFEVWIVVGAFYFALCFGLALLFAWLEARLARPYGR